MVVIHLEKQPSICYFYSCTEWTPMMGSYSYISILHDEFFSEYVMLKSVTKVTTFKPLQQGLEIFDRLQ